MPGNICLSPASPFKTAGPWIAPKLTSKLFGQVPPGGLRGRPWKVDRQPGWERVYLFSSGSSDAVVFTGKIDKSSDAGRTISDADIMLDDGRTGCQQRTEMW